VITDPFGLNGICLDHFQAVWGAITSAYLRMCAFYVILFYFIFKEFRRWESTKLLLTN
jgi:hypothetical protein